MEKKNHIKILGVCPCCNEDVYEDHLYVIKKKKVYHFYCYSIKKAKK